MRQGLMALFVMVLAGCASRGTYRVTDRGQTHYVTGFEYDWSLGTRDGRSVDGGTVYLSKDAKVERLDRATFDREVEFARTARAQREAEFNAWRRREDEYQAHRRSVRHDLWTKEWLSWFQHFRERGYNDEEAEIKANDVMPMPGL